MSSSIQSQSISMRFNPDTITRLDEIAQNRQCSRSELIKEAVEGYLDAQIWFENKVKQGLEDIRAGRVVCHEEVKNKVRGLGYHVD